MTGLVGLTWRKVHSPSASPETWATNLKSTERGFQLEIAEKASPTTKPWISPDLLTDSLSWSCVCCLHLITVFHFIFRWLNWRSDLFHNKPAGFYLFWLLRLRHSLLKSVYLTFIYLNTAINALQLLISGHLQANSKFSDHYPWFECNYSMSV